MNDAYLSSAVALFRDIIIMIDDCVVVIVAHTSCMKTVSPCLLSL